VSPDICVSFCVTFFKKRSLVQETLLCVRRPSGEIVFLKITKKSTKPLPNIIRLIEQNLQVADIIRLLPRPCRQFLGIDASCQSIKIILSGFGQSLA
jgi:hypothetical protein